MNIRGGYLDFPNLVRTDVGWVFLSVLGINGVLDWVYAYMLTKSYFLKNSDPLPTRQFLKVNSCLAS